VLIAAPKEDQEEKKGNRVRVVGRRKERSVHVPDAGFVFFLPAEAGITAHR